MSTDPTTDLSAVVAELQERIRHLEDIEALRNLKAEYAAACDDNYDADRLAALFVEDATWKARAWGDTKAEKRFASSFAEFPATSSLLYITG